MEIVLPELILMTITKCNTTPSFIRKVASVVRGRVHSLIIEMQSPLNTICLSTLFAAFPDLETLSIEYALLTSWMPNQPTKLQKLHMDVHDLDAIRGLDFKKFFEKQACNFRMELDIDLLPVHCRSEFYSIINQSFQKYNRNNDGFADLAVGFSARETFYKLNDHFLI
uniref:FTH domain-containing protein n=1 Tax=Panagrellus redivivus TaxID=6233 RepID=A0A7E4VQ27_PANRE